MSVREFLDTTGRAWRAWDILPEAIHPRVRAEDYLADCYETGWVVFETFDGRDKRRLCPYPKAWDTASDAELRKLLDRAEVVPASRMSQGDIDSASSRFGKGASRPAGISRDTVPDLTDLEVIRTFRYPGGRVWSAGIAYRVDSDAPVLRFTAGARSIDLRNWPRDWADYPDERLIDLLRIASPRQDRVPAPPGTPQRRYSDPRRG